MHWFSVRLVLCSVLALFLAACGAVAPARDPAARDPGDTLVLAIGGESDNGYDPTLGWGRYGAPLFQSTLLRRNADLHIVNDLATGYTVSDDGLVWTVTIRADVVFSDGEPLTAQDVAYTFNTAAASGGLTDVTVLDEAVALDTTTVEMRLKRPQSTFLHRLITLGIVPEHAHGEGYARNPIGSGPYQMVQWDAGQQLIVQANPHYYGDPPALERLVFLFVDEDTAFAAVQAGDVHVASVPQALAVQQIDGMTLYAVPSVDNRGLLFPYVSDTGDESPDGHPVGNDVTADHAIRQAVNYAIDREALVAGVLEGFGSPAHGPVSGLPWEEPEAIISDGDPARARQILAAGGWSDEDGDGILEKDGLRAAFTIVYPASDSTRQALALAAADMLVPLGIDVTVEGKSWDEIDARKHRQVVVFGWGSHDQTEMYNLYHSSMAGSGFYNAGYYANQQIDSLLDLAMGATTQEEAMMFWQAAQWDGEQGFTAKGDAAWAWLVNLEHTYFVDDCLDIGQPQVEPHGHGWPITAGIIGWEWTCTD
jgi:peptide/nickel transport system substrate-binding protein